MNAECPPRCLARWHTLSYLVALSVDSFVKAKGAPQVLYSLTHCLISSQNLGNSAKLLQGSLIIGVWNSAPNSRHTTPSLGSQPGTGIFNGKLEIFEGKVVPNGIFVINPWHKWEEEKAGWSGEKMHVLIGRWIQSQLWGCPRAQPVPRSLRHSLFSTCLSDTYYG